MTKFPLSLLLITFLLYSCQMKKDDQATNKWKLEILKTEQNFAALAKKEGIHTAFMTYAAEEAVLMRNNDLIIGKSNIDLFYQNKDSKGLSWTPEFIDVATSGELGYTYGYFTFSYKDSVGNDLEEKGVFHTVWKKQADGTWRFVWD